jgi:glycosyltransferase involved in cell wall biosynthesis
MNVSVIIPARNEKYLQTTLDSLYENAGMEIEVVVVLDGPTQYPLTKKYPNLVVRENFEPIGIRASIERGIKISKGDLILKVDAHCIFGEDFVKTLERDAIEDRTVMVARRWTLNLETMERQPRIVDYYYLSCPWTNTGHFMMQSCPWITRTEQRLDIPIDDLMCFQGSMWMTTRNFASELPWINEEMLYAEHHMISMSAWANGGRVVINKNTWYAHPSRITGGYRMDMNKVYWDHARSAHTWTNQATFFEWLVDKFWPLPTEHNRHRLEKYYWPENWKEMVRNVD